MNICANCGKSFEWNENTCCVNENEEECCADCYQNVFCFCDKGCYEVLRYKNAKRYNDNGDYVGIFCDKCWEKNKGGLQ